MKNVSLLIKCDKEIFGSELTVLSHALGKFMPRKNRLSKSKSILGVLKFEQRLSPTILVCLCYSSLNNLFHLLRCPFSVARLFAKYL